MSLITTVLIYECDDSGCPKIIAVKSQKDRELFEALWHTGTKYDFCPNCRNKVETQARIAADLITSQTMRRRIEEKIYAADFSGK